MRRGYVSFWGIGKARFTFSLACGQKTHDPGQAVHLAALTGDHVGQIFNGPDQVGGFLFKRIDAVHLFAFHSGPNNPLVVRRVSNPPAAGPGRCRSP